MCIINIEEIRASDQLKKKKCREVKEEMKGILTDDQLEKFDRFFDPVMDKVLKGVILKENENTDIML